MRDMIDYGVTGIHVPCRQKRALARTLTDLVAQPDLITELGHAARRRAIDDYGMDAMVARYAQLINDGRC